MFLRTPRRTALNPRKMRRRPIVAGDCSRRPGSKLSEDLFEEGHLFYIIFRAIVPPCTSTVCHSGSGTMTEERTQSESKLGSKVTPLRETVVCIVRERCLKEVRA